MLHGYYFGTGGKAALFIMTPPGTLWRLIALVALLLATLPRTRAQIEGWRMVDRFSGFRFEIHGKVRRRYEGLWRHHHHHHHHHHPPP